MIDKTGGPAFPLDRDCCNVGMTLRDYFAAKAMQSAYEYFLTDEDAAENWTFKEIANCAYAMADVMLQERSK